MKIKQNRATLATPILGLVALIMLSCSSEPLQPQARVEKNVVYGMYAGLALLMDVYYPEQPNGHGIIYIRGSGWHAPTPYGTRQLKRNYVQAVFLDAGFTVFSVNHRGTPRFQYPAAVEDVQRAVRFIRHHAQRYGIDPVRIGAYGHSSGGHLVSMLGVLDGDGDPNDSDPVNRMSAKVQAVVARAAVFDLAPLNTEAGIAAVIDFLGEQRSSGGSATYTDASPVTHVTPDDAPFLLIHGDADPVVPIEQSELMHQILAKNGVPAKLRRIAGGGHGAFDAAEAGRWLTMHLIGETEAKVLEPLFELYGILDEGVELARQGKIQDALAAYTKTQSGNLKITVSDWQWNNLCWYGALWGYPADVMPACEKGVALSPENGDYRDSRGVARALTGDFEGAISDFETYVAYTSSDEFRALRQEWIDALRAGENPLTPEVLKKELEE